MCGELNRYFIELQSTEIQSAPRNKEAELRRQMAAQFMEVVSQWLNEHEWGDKVSNMAITALGQVQITCEADVINQIRSHEELNIAAIRQSATLGSMLSENAPRWNEAR